LAQFVSAIDNEPGDIVGATYGRQFIIPENELIGAYVGMMMKNGIEPQSHMNKEWMLAQMRAEFRSPDGEQWRAILPPKRGKQFGGVKGRGPHPELN